VVNNEPFLGAKKLVGDDERTNRVVACAATGIADDVCVALCEACVLGGVEAGVPEPVAVLASRGHRTIRHMSCLQQALQEVRT